MVKRSHVIIYTDGACSGNPGPGGWGALLKYGPQIKELKGGEKNTTNNRMELTAAIEALNALTRPCRIDLYTDSEYLKKGVTEWMENWKRLGWKRGTTRKPRPLANDDLWKALDQARQPHHITWHWVKAHAGDRLNERVDQLAREAIP
jgi:ribonuclease HI